MSSLPGTQASNRPIPWAAGLPQPHSVSFRSGCLALSPLVGFSRPATYHAGLAEPQPSTQPAVVRGDEPASLRNYMEQNIKDRCNELRAEILKIGNAVNGVHKHSVFDGEQSASGQHSEMHANLTLAYRHLEDARMRLGKVIQAHEGGVSCYDKGQSL